MLLSQANGKRMTQELELPQLEVELERAIWQVETAIKKQNEEVAEKRSHNKDASSKAEDVSPPEEEKKNR